jgi:hypothetical protein
MSPNAGGWGVTGVSANEYSCAHGAQINFGDLTPYLTYDCAFLRGRLEHEKVTSFTASYLLQYLSNATIITRYTWMVISRKENYMMDLKVTQVIYGQ